LSGLVCERGQDANFEIDVSGEIDGVRAHDRWRPRKHGHESDQSLSQQVSGVFIELIPLGEDVGEPADDGSRPSRDATGMVRSQPKCEPGQPEQFWLDLRR